MATQTVRIPLEGNLPYSIDIEAIGFFRLIDNHNSDLLAAQAIAHQVLYSAVRELVLTNTGRMAWGAFSIGLATLDGGAQKAPDEVPPVIPAAKAKRKKSPSHPKRSA